MNRGGRNNGKKIVQRMVHKEPSDLSYPCDRALYSESHSVFLNQGNSRRDTSYTHEDRRIHTVLQIFLRILRVLLRSSGDTSLAAVVSRQKEILGSFHCGRDRKRSCVRVLRSLSGTDDKTGGLPDGSCAQGREKRVGFLRFCGKSAVYRGRGRAELFPVASRNDGNACRSARNKDEQRRAEAPSVDKDRFDRGRNRNNRFDGFRETALRDRRGCRMRNRDGDIFHRYGNQKKKRSSRSVTGTIKRTDRSLSVFLYANYYIRNQSWSSDRRVFRMRRLCRIHTEIRRGLSYRI